MDIRFLIAICIVWFINGNAGFPLYENSDLADLFHDYIYNKTHMFDRIIIFDNNVLLLKKTNTTIIRPLAYDELCSLHKGCVNLMTLLMHYEPMTLCLRTPLQQEAQQVITTEKENLQKRKKMIETLIKDTEIQ